MKNQSVHTHSGYIESNHIPYAVTSPIGNSFRGPVAKILSPRFQSQRQSWNAGSTVSCHRRAVSHAQGSSKRLYFVQVPEIGVSLPYRHGRERKHRSGEKSIEAPIQRLSISCSYHRYRLRARYVSMLFRPRSETIAQKRGSRVPRQ